MVRGKITLDTAERHELQHRMRATTIAVRDRQRAEIILLRAKGLTQGQIAAGLGCTGDGERLVSALPDPASRRAGRCTGPRA